MRLASATAGLHAAAGTLLAVGAGASFGQCVTTCPTGQQVQVCIDAGRNDSFAAPLDPASPRAGFASYFCAGNCKDFDDSLVNYRFLHTFSGIPCGIVSATLEIKLRAECDIPGNDTINLQFSNASNTFTWGRAIRDLPGAEGAWECPTTATFSLNLAALPTTSGTINIIPQINSDHFLDMYVQDDTTVDYARLTVRVCPCEGGYRAYTSGYADDFAATPVDPPAWRQPRLTAIRNNPPFLWRDTDDCTQDRGYGYTFGPLPGGIARATFTMKMKACPLPDVNGGANDSLALEMLNPGVPLVPYSNANFYRTFQLTTLMGGTWTANQVGQLSMNLGTTLTTGALACGSMLGPLADGYFDVYVQDDTSVDYATLRIWSCPPLVRNFGLVTDAMGAAILSPGPAGSLVVSGLGSTGQDGVSFDMHAAAGAEVMLDPAYTDVMPIGGFLEASVQADADGDGVVERTAAIRAAKHFPDGLWLDSPAAAAPGGCTTVVLSNSATGERVETCLPADGSVMTIGDAVGPVEWRRDDLGRLRMAMQLCYVKCCDVNLVASDGTSLFGDTVEFVHDVPGEIEQMSLNWGNEHGGGEERSAQVDHCKIVLDRDTGRSKASRLGNAAVDTNPGSLTVSNIGSSGNDGVSIECFDAGSLTAAVDGPCAGTVEDCLGSMDLRMTGTGTFAGDKVPIVRGSALGRGGGVFDLAADFGDIGASTVLIEIIEGDAVTGSVTVDGPAMVSALGGSPPTVWRTRKGMQDLSTTIFNQEHGRHTPFHNRGALLGIGDGVRFTAISPVFVPDAVTGMSFTATGMDEMLVRGVETTPPETGPTCFADFNQDGGIDGADVAAFFGAWEEGDPGTDVNEDGGVDGADVELFFAQWSAGGCD